MKKVIGNSKTRVVFLSIFVLGLFLVGGVAGIFESKAQGTGATIDNFDLSPKIFCSKTPSTQLIGTTLRVTISVSQFFTSCGNSANSFDWRIVRARDVARLVRGTQVINFNSSNQTYNLSGSMNIDLPVNDPYDDFYSEIACGGATSGRLTQSQPWVRVNYGSNNLIWACVASNNIFACSPGNYADCRDASACSGRPCIQIGSNLCSQSAVGASCNGGGGGSIPPSQGGETQNIEWGITNPLIGMDPNQNIFDVIILITDWILNIAGSLIVFLIIYGGVMFLISAGNPGKITQAKNILKWAFVGFAVTLIGKGFVYLVESVLQGNIPTFL